MRSKNIKIVASNNIQHEHEEFLEHKTKKRWVDGSGDYCFAVYPRALYIAWSNDHRYWDWKCFKETSDDKIEVIKLVSICWFDVRGKFKISDLTPGVVYEIVYEVKLSKSASGWERPTTTKLSLPDGTSLERQVSMFEKPKGEWIELNLGHFLAKKDQAGEVSFELHQFQGHWKSGLHIRAAVIRPK